MPDMMTFRLPESEKRDFRQWVYKQKSEIMAECRTLIPQTLHDIARWAKMGAPVDKGFLRSSIKVLISQDHLGGAVYTNRHYAPYQEFGTGKYVFKNYSQYNRAVPGLEEYASQFKGQGIRKVNIYPKAYLFPAYNLGVRNMMLKLKKMGFEPKK